ncbi:hypothetical protein [Streptomyces atroolivaceus]|uniref:AAA+ ATPase domain-containing protein n=1 Tax=Streptomyces atroolivaceus TaxID=66869 RepID=A0ABV9VIS5_STRAZ|nr:hypothetical protein [Streptomyces atroolivaceus]
MSDRTGLRLRKPGAGREPAASALLTWLTDPHSPQLCILTGPTGAGKSHLLAWLLEHGGTTSPDPSNRRIHAVAPLTGVGLRGAAWLLADHLRLPARAPGELVAAVTRDKRHTVLILCDLHLSHAPEAILEQLIQPLLQITHVKLIIESRTGAPCTEQLLGHTLQPAVMDLTHPRWTDPDGFRRWAQTANSAADTEHCYPLPGLAVQTERKTEPQSGQAPFAFTAQSLVQADPHTVTAWLDQQPAIAERASDLGRAWLRAGQSLCACDTPSTRALTLLAALDSTTAADTRRVLHDLARPEPWRVAHTSTRKNTNSYWPGPTTALCTGAARYAQRVLCADHLGDVRVLDHADGAATGRLTSSHNRPTAAVLCLPDGTVVAVDDFGGVSLVGEAPPSRPGLQALLEPEAEPWTQLRRVALTFPTRIPGATLTAAASLPDGAVFGDSSGHVHALRLKEDVVDVTSHVLHDGPVTALAGLALEGTGPTLVYSGGADGRIRAWSPGTPPMPEPLLHRPDRVVDLGASSDEGHPAELAAAWADGLVQYINLDSGVILPFRPGPPVRAVCCLRTSAGEPRVMIGMDDCMTTLVPHPQPAHND